MWQVNHPVYWWAFLALVVPIIIHLYNRRRTKVKVMGTLRWLTEVQTAQWNFRRIHQWPLLLIRLLLFTVVVLLLVDLFKKDKPGSREKLNALILIHPAAGDTSQYRQLAAGWQNDSVNIHWLAPGFPAATEQVTQTSIHIWSLVAEAGLRFQADSIHIIAPNQRMYFTGAPRPITAALSWELIDIPGDSVRLVWSREVNNEPELLWFRTQADLSEYHLQRDFQNFSTAKAQITYSADKKQVEVKKGIVSYGVSVTAPDTLTITSVVDKETEEEWYLFKKAVQAVATYQEVPVKFVEGNSTATDWLLLFSQDTAQPFKATPDLLIWTYKPGKSAGWLEPAEKNKLVIRKELTTAHILEGGLLEALRPYILAFKYKQALPTQADYRKVDLPAGKWQGEKQTATLPESVQQKAGNERLWLGLFSLLLLTLERVWQKKVE